MVVVRSYVHNDAVASTSGVTLDTLEVAKKSSLNEKLFEMCTRVLSSMKIKNKTRFRLKNLLLQTKQVMTETPGFHDQLPPPSDVPMENVTNVTIEEKGAEQVTDKPVVRNYHDEAITLDMDKDDGDKQDDEILPIPKFPTADENAEIDLPAIIDVGDECDDHLTSEFDTGNAANQYIQEDAGDDKRVGCFSYIGTKVRKLFRKRSKRNPGPPSSFAPDNQPAVEEPTTASVGVDEVNPVADFLSSLGIIVLAIVTYCFGLYFC